VATGLKHLITCRCVLPQLKRVANSPSHQFAVFSAIEDDGSVRVRYAQCNNCGIIHRVTEINKSDVVPREAMRAIPTIDDIKASLPPRLVDVLEMNDADLPTWEAAQFIVENKRWGDFVVLSTDEEDGLRQGKYVRIIGENLLKVETFTREETTSK